jgi:hypothetical protein
LVPLPVSMIALTLFAMVQSCLEIERLLPRVFEFADFFFND